MKDLIKKLLDLVKRALANDPDNVEEREKLRQEVAALTGENKDLKAEKADIEALKPEINEVIDLATKATPVVQ